MRAVFTLALALLLAACGFQLRGTAQLPFDTLYMPPTTVPGIALDLKRNIQSGTNTKVIDDPQKAEAVLEFLQEFREKHILSLAATGRVREFQLRYRVIFRVHEQGGGSCLPARCSYTRDIPSTTRTCSRRKPRSCCVPRHAVRHGQQIMRRLAAAQSRSPPRVGDGRERPRGQLESQLAKPSPASMCCTATSRCSRLRLPMRSAPPRASRAALSARSSPPSAASTGASSRRPAPANRCSATARSSSCASRPASPARRAPLRSRNTASTSARRTSRWSACRGCARRPGLRWFGALADAGRGGRHLPGGPLAAAGRIGARWAAQRQRAGAEVPPSRRTRRGNLAEHQEVQNSAAASEGELSAVQVSEVVPRCATTPTIARRRCSTAKRCAMCALRTGLRGEANHPCHRMGVARVARVVRIQQGVAAAPIEQCCAKTRLGEREGMVAQRQGTRAPALARALAHAARSTAGQRRRAANLGWFVTLG